MHIPDGFLDIKTVSAFYGISIVGVGFATASLNKRITEKHIPLLGVVAAFIFAVQMLNFPVAGGTSGHFLGSVLAAVLLGPLSGLMIITTVLVVQCLVFQDGGLSALGANIFNMGIVGSVLGYYIYFVISKFLRNKSIAIFISSWLSIVLASISCAFQLALSKTVALNIVLPTMVGVHALIGIGEGIITVTVIRFISKIRTDLLELPKV